MAKRIKFTGLSEHQFWSGDDKQTPALVIFVGTESKAEEHYAELRCRNGDIVEYDRLGNAQLAVDQGVAVLIEDERPAAKTPKASDTSTPAPA